jgi:hypothetical protein
MRSPAAVVVIDSREFNRRSASRRPSTWAWVRPLGFSDRSLTARIRNDASPHPLNGLRDCLSLRVVRGGAVRDQVAFGESVE